MNEFETYEYVVAEGRTGRLRLRKALLIAGYVLFAAVMLLFAAASRLGAPLVALTPFALALLIFLTWRYTKVEFEYSITSGEMTVSKILGGRTRRELISFHLRDCVVIAPPEDRAWREKGGAFHTLPRISALSVKDAPDAYLAAFEDANGRRGAVCFEATQKALRICHFYNPSATVLSKVSK